MVKDPKQLISNLLAYISSGKYVTQGLSLVDLLSPLLNNPSVNQVIQARAPSEEPKDLSPSNSENSALLEIKASLSSLTKAVASLQAKPPPKASRGKPNLDTKSKSTTPTTYASRAASKPSNHSIVVDLSSIPLDIKDRPRPELISAKLNSQLSSSYPQKIHIAAVRWTARGNLIITSGPNTPSQVLQSASPTISSILHKAFKQPTSAPPPPTRPNVRWSKLLINGVPTYASEDRGPLSPEECHEALHALNPSYATLLVTRKPSWVRTPSSYQQDSISSLVVAFEDPDGSALRTMLTERYLYIKGVRAKVHKWKQPQPQKKDPSKKHATSPPPSEGESSDEEDINIILDLPTTPPHPSTPNNTHGQSSTGAEKLRALLDSPRPQPRSKSKQATQPRTQPSHTTKAPGKA